MFSLIVYVAVLIYSGALAVYFLFIASKTRLGS
jgi:NADH:ubiquinone oxidoreductase subunit 6 (subunit J)